MYTLGFWLMWAMVAITGWLLLTCASLGVNEVAEWLAVAVEPHVP